MLSNGNMGSVQQYAVLFLFVVTIRLGNGRLGNVVQPTSVLKIETTLHIVTLLILALLCSASEATSLKKCTNLAGMLRF